MIEDGCVNGIGILRNAILKKDNANTRQENEVCIAEKEESLTSIYIYIGNYAMSHSPSPSFSGPN